MFNSRLSLSPVCVLVLLQQPESPGAVGGSGSDSVHAFTVQVLLRAFVLNYVYLTFIAYFQCKLIFYERYVYFGNQ